VKVVSEQDAVELVSAHYGIKGASKKLNGEIDLNFYIRDLTGKEFVLKIANPKENIQQLELQNAVMKHLAASNVGLNLQQVVRSIRNEEIVHLTIDGEVRFMRLLTWIEGRVFAEVKPHSWILLYRVGEMCGKLSKGLSGLIMKVPTGL